MIFSASSPKEELEWRSRLVERACKEQIAIFDPAFFAALSLDMKSLGVVFGKPGEKILSARLHTILKAPRFNSVTRWALELTYNRHDCTQDLNT
jgi:hypothetical protein